MRVYKAHMRESLKAHTLPSWFSRLGHPLSYSRVCMCVACVQYLCEHASRLCGAWLGWPMVLG